MKRKAGALLLIFILVTAAARSENNFQLKTGDRVVFYGDNVSEVQFYDNVDEPQLYTTFVEVFALTRFPEKRFSFTNSAWGGDKVAGGWGGSIDLRLKRDVIAHKPTVLAIMLGMNDAKGLGYNPELLDTFARGYAHILSVVRKGLPGIRITLLEPSPYDDVTRPPTFGGGYNSVLMRYGAFIRDLGLHEGLTVVDMNSPLVEILRKAKAVGPELAQGIVPDRTLPGPAGQLILAETLLKAWNAPATVSSVEIDSAAKRVIRSSNCSVTGLRIANNLSWTQTDDALPFPINLTDPEIALVVRLSDFVQTLDYQPLKVTGLTAQHYLLKIDGEKIARFDGEQLDRGVDLALLDTPMQKQAWRVYRLTLERNDLYFGRWRQVQVARGVLYKEAVGKNLLNTPVEYLPPFQDDLPVLTRSALHALDDLMQDLVHAQYAAAQPKAHIYELIPE
jgi:lysophospholipase L1-like esterase